MRRAYNHRDEHSSRATGSSFTVDRTSIEITDPASRRVADKGSRIYLWQEPFGAEWVRDRLALDPPGGVTFREIPAGLISLMVEEHIPLPSLIVVDITRTPPRRLRVMWDGRRWGWRGGGLGPVGDTG